MMVLHYLLIMNQATLNKNKRKKLYNGLITEFSLNFLYNDETYTPNRMVIHDLFIMK